MTNFGPPNNFGQPNVLCWLCYWECLRDLIAKIVNLKHGYRLLKFPEEHSIFSITNIVKTFCHFPNIRMRRNAFREEAIAGPQSGSNRVLKCWITKGWWKTTWVKFWASPAGNTNQILIEDVLQVVTKVTQSVEPTSGEISIKTTTKRSWEKHAYVQGVWWVTIEVDRR